VRRVFVDSGAFFAVAAAKDASHDLAKLAFATAESEHWQLITTNAVVVETYALFLARTREKQAAAVMFLDRLRETSVLVERVQPPDEERAEALVRSHGDKAYSLCDALSFVVMERLGVTEAIAYDSHFREYGSFVLL
jgi:predicted nucleic acid-binding protein